MLVELEINTNAHHDFGDVPLTCALDEHSCDLAQFFFMLEKDVIGPLEGQHFFRYTEGLACPKDCITTKDLHQARSKFSGAIL